MSSKDKSEIRFKEKLYRLIISQLFYDNYQSVAVELSNLIQVFDYNFTRLI
jgi:hypothetical protein